MATIEINMYQTLAIATAALYLGAFLRKKIYPLEYFCIPTPVIGGLIAAAIACILYTAGIAELNYDDTLKDFFMIMFFTSVGFKADMKIIKRGGRDLLLLVIGIVVLIFLQNGAALGLSRLLHIDPRLALCTGSISMIGGHGTSGAFGPILEDFGLEGATTVAIAAATFGLIAGGLMGGPLGNSLIVRKDLLKTAKHPEKYNAAREKKKAAEKHYQHYPEAVFMLCIIVGIGTVLSMLLSKTGMAYPAYVGALLAATFTRNISQVTGKIKIYMDEIENIGEICLSLFLGIAMITLKIWQLYDLAVPMLILLGAQVIIMFLYARFAVFNVMGKDYDAAVITAGMCGFGLGVTANAMANMQTLCDRYVPSVKAYLLIPIVGTIFNDFFNSLIITLFINIE